MNSIEVELYGRVQGVRLRNIIQNYARKLKLKGYVKNKTDGGVYLIAYGERNHLEDFISWIQKSPGLSRIDKMISQWRKGDNSKEEYNDFFIVKDYNFLKDQSKSFLNLKRAFFRKNIPLHVTLIPDGNRRWAKSNGLDAVEGYAKVGEYSHILSLFQEARKLGVRYVSVWGFSTENWNRDSREIDYLFNLMNNVVQQFIDKCEENKIYFRHIGRKDRLPKNLMLKINELEERTNKYSDFSVLLCLDYGGRDEIIRAVNKLLQKKVRKVDEKVFSKYLDSTGIPDPDLIIRTSGEQRISGFMPFQGVYSEFYFTDLHFPDFGVEELREAILQYSDRTRKFGGNG